MDCSRKMDGLSAVVQQRLQSQAQALNAAIGALRDVSSRLHSVDHVGPAGSTGEEIAVEPFAAVHTPAAPYLLDNKLCKLQAQLQKCKSCVIKCF